MSNSNDAESLSVSAMVIRVILLIAYGCWAIAASAHLGSMFEVVAPEPGMGRLGGRTRGLMLFATTIVSFVLNSLRIDHAPGIIRNTLTNERWILVMFFLLAGAAVIFGMWAKKLEADLAGPKRKSRRKRKGSKRKRPKTVD